MGPCSKSNEAILGEAMKCGMWLSWCMAIRAIHFIQHARERREDMISSDIWDGVMECLIFCTNATRLDVNSRTKSYHCFQPSWPNCPSALSNQNDLFHFFHFFDSFNIFYYLSCLSLFQYVSLSLATFRYP